MNPKLVWPVVVLVGIGMTAATVMALAGVGPGTIAGVMSMLVLPVLAAMLAAKQAETGAVVQQVKEQTNGNIGRLIDLIERQGVKLAESTPPPVDQQDRPAA